MNKGKGFLAASGICLLGLVGVNGMIHRAGPEYLAGSVLDVREESSLGTSIVLRESVTAPEDMQNLAICQAADYVNIRQQASTASPVVGKIHRHAAANIVAEVSGEGGNWYQIQSGTVNGYVKASYFLTGTQAEAAAKEVGICYATINTAALRLRAEPNVSSQTLTTLRQGAEYIMLEEQNHFAKLAVDETLTGYVSMDYITTRMVFPQAVSLAEEAARQAEEARRKQEAEAAIQKLEEVKLVEAKNDPAGIPAAQKGSITQENSVTDIQGTIAANPLGQGNHPQMAAPGTNTADTAGTAHTANSANTVNIANTTNTANPVNPAGPTLAGVTMISPSAAPASTLAGLGEVPAGPYSTETTVFYGPGGNASKELVSATRTALVAYAKQFLGNPYVYGGDSLTAGADCSGFVMRIFEHFGIDTGRNSREQAGKGRQIAIEAVQPGDLLFYASGDTINHVAIYIGGGQVIHAASAKTGIVISPADYRTACRAVSFLD